MYALSLKDKTASCMCVCVLSCVEVHMFRCGYACGGRRTKSDVIPQEISTFWEEVSHRLEHAQYASLSCKQAPRICISISQYWDYKHAHHCAQLFIECCILNWVTSQPPVRFYPQYQVASKMNSLGFPLMYSLVENRDLLTSSYIYWRNKWMNELLKLVIYLTVNFLTSKIRKMTSIPWISCLSKLKK